ncbi:type I-U CRISPR-associated helicase/endonuclease Cas3 [Gemmatimonas sp.]|uniref:type I-G CRISPR-associated helicase/endonuclease Cas3g n=1 Tax=Gemmatimonas sp. TaxID=1962908 RepID=UPI0025C104E9|nr:type I-U CRISPR-associated helicase/endonuclease Cas3 [Gemmatimonas sp.]MCA2993047.1 type I-U CRISPR-associated helicase/endonuclease Cas3 [Gemmatimonas sp.]
MTTPSFAGFYRALWGRDPFPWQERLANVVATRGWPAALDIPTGCGKTSTIEIALWHLISAPEGSAPRRIVYVVDRRLVVDGTARHARAIADAIARADAQSVLGRVAQRLRALGGGDEALQVVTLRGGVPRDHAWAGDPLQPLIVLSTVDQVGSRLLFRGYGVSNAMRPVHAALIARDALLLLDEAHLSEPFRQTVHTLRPFVTDGEGAAAVPSLQLVLLSATLPADAEERFTLDTADRNAPALAARLGADKLAQLTTTADQDDAFARHMCDQVQALLSAEADTVLVVCNRVASARRVFDTLQAHSGGALDLALLIGPSRAVQREEQTKQWIDRVRAGRERQQGHSGAKPFVLVATQCVEAGVDFDVDALVTESAPLDALRQRFGRLDRLGQAPNRGAVRAVVVHRQRRTEDPVYGDRIEHTWEWLTRHAEASSGKATRGAAKLLPVIDFGLDAMGARLQSLAPHELELLLTERPNAPRLLPHHVEAWSETSAGSDLPAPSLFLHGPRGAPPVRIGWRADLERMKDRVLQPVESREATAALSLLPPSPGELVEVSLGTLRRWMDDARHTGADLEADVPVAAEEGLRIVQVTGRSRQLFRERYDGSWERIGAAAVRPGDLLMAPASQGGCDEYGWAPDSSAIVEDVAEVAHEQYRGEWVHRVHPQVRPAEWSRIQRGIADGLDEHELLSQLRDAVVPPTHAGTRMTLAWYDPARSGGALVLRAGLGVRGREFEPESTAGDDGSFIAEPVALDEHLRDVEHWVDCFAARLAVGETERVALLLAARWHDVGKCDPAFQALLRGEDAVSRFDRRPLLAKSGERAWRYRAAAPLPRGWRHEVLSTVMAADLIGHEPVEVRDLSLWLIATHHGRGRLFFDEVGATSSPAGACVVAGQSVVRPAGVTAQEIMADHAERGERLAARYGAYGLAYLETILRLADHRASARAAATGGAA